jgi:predicted MFS family arabinose efflux permease
MLIRAAGYSATQAGAALLPLPLVIAAASPAAGALAAKVRPRWLLITGPVIVAAGTLVTLRIGSATSYWLGGVSCDGRDCFGNGLCGRPAHDSGLMSVDGRHTGTASGLNSAVARVGGLVAVRANAYLWKRAIGQNH